MLDADSAAVANGFAEELYRNEGLPMDDGRRRTILELAAHPEFGGAWLIEADGEAVGYVVLTACYSLEFHGRFGLLDEFFIAAEWRGKGLGTAALAFVDDECRRRGSPAVRLEVAWENPRGQELYRRGGFKRDERHLMTKWL